MPIVRRKKKTSLRPNMDILKHEPPKKNQNTFPKILVDQNKVDSIQPMQLNDRFDRKKAAAEIQRIY